MTDGIKKWPLLSRSLHWLSALFVFGLFAVGYYMTGLGYYDPLYHTLPWWHKSFGLLLMALVIVRLGYRAKITTPPPEPGHSRFEKRAAALTHALLYLLILAIGISGYLISTAEGKGIVFFGWFEVPALSRPFDGQADIAGLVHLWLAWSLIALVAIHAAGALKHHFIDRDNTLKRML
ncbi:cytochrome b [Granulosicoccaceae sp. 1_MG-2023]|nr:cytochrome b [Granulosicoccaceae sp. 1_MG-2023]